MAAFGLFFMMMLAYWKYMLALYIAYLGYDLLKLSYQVYVENKKFSDSGYKNGTYGFLHSIIEDDLIEIYENNLKENEVDLYATPITSNELRKVLPRVKGGLGVSRSWNYVFIFSVVSLCIMYFVVNAAYN